MLTTMPARKSDKAEPAKKPKETVTCRIDVDSLAKLDQIASAMTIEPTRSQLIDLAVREYVERNYPPKGAR